MRFFDDPLVADAHRARHQQAHVAYDVIRQGGIGNFVAFDVQPEFLALQAAAIAEVDPEVEHHALPRHLRGAHFAAARWLTATLPRISNPAAIIVGVTGSPRNSHANAAPNSGTR